MKKVFDYIRSVRAEWFKIVWPSRDTVVRSTIMILVFSGAAALFFFFLDKSIGYNLCALWILMKNADFCVRQGKKHRNNLFIPSIFNAVSHKKMIFVAIKSLSRPPQVSAAFVLCLHNAI